MILFLFFCALLEDKLPSQFVVGKQLKNKISMKKYLLIIILSLSAIYAIGQDFGTGIRFGLNYSTSSISDIFRSNDMDIDTATMNSAFVTGLSAAAIFEFGLKKYTAIQPEIRYSQSETNLTPDTITNTETGLVFDKVEVPVLFKVKVGTDLLKLNLIAGPNFGFITRANTEVRSTSPDNPTDPVRTRVDKSNFDTFDYSNIAGFGLTIVFNNFALFADYRYNFKFRKFNSVRQDGFIDNLGSNIGGGFIFYY